MTTTIWIWIKGIIAAAIGGASSSITVFIVDPLTFNFAEGLGKLGTVAGIGALLAVAAYLTKSPIWNDNQQTGGDQ